jgi:hypothetical protein
VQRDRHPFAGDPVDEPGRVAHQHPARPAHGPRPRQPQGPGHRRASQDERARLTARGLRQGLFTTGTIELESRDVLAVPTSAVRIDQAEPYVLAVIGERIERRKVTLGVRGELIVDGRIEPAVELASGVEDGAVVLRGSTGAVRAGSAVRLAVGATPSASAPR